jgi:hypothetical protein
MTDDEEEEETEKGLHLLSQMYFSHQSEYNYLHTAQLNYN